MAVIKSDGGESIDDAIRRGARELSAVAGGGATLEARTLLLECLQLDDYAQLLSRAADAFPSAAAACYQAFIQDRRAGRPIAYILGWREFYGHRFRTTPAALIPRPETEELVTLALWHLPDGQPARVLDLGAGCGAIGVSIALARQTATVLLSEVGEETLALARENAAQHKVVNAQFLRGDWYAALDDASPLDLIVSNPPYIADDDEHLRRGDLRFEPPLALVGGADGLESLRRVIAGASQRLRRGGVLMVENGHDQAAAVRQLFAAAGFCGILQRRDMAGHERITLGVNP